MEQHSRNHRGINLALVILGFLMVVWIGEATSGFDRMTTIATDTTLARCIVLIPSGLFSIFLVYALLTGRAGSATLKKLKVDQPWLWFLSAIFLALVLAIGCFWILNALAGSTAQHLDGDIHLYELQVVDVTRIRNRKNPCLIRVETQEIQEFGAASFCVYPRHGEAIGPENIQPGERILLAIKSTPLGTVATSVRRID